MNDDIIYQAAHVIYSSEFADALEERGDCFHGEITSQVEPLTPAEHDPIIRPLLAKIEKSIGAKLADVFDAGGIEDQYDALSDLLMGVRGHGVSIYDTYKAQWKKGLAACGGKDNLPYDEMCEYSDLAHAKLDTAGYPAEGDETNENEPFIKTAYDWQGGQATSLYAFASTGMVQSETHRAAIMEEIDADIEWNKQHGEQEEGDVAKLQRLRKAVESAALDVKFFYN